MINYYKILGLEDGASLSDIEASYNKLSKDLDPANNDNQEFFVEEFKLLKEAYKALTGKDVEVENSIDESILGGFILRIGDVQYNASVANQLNKLKREFTLN